MLYTQKLNAILIKNDLENDSMYDWMKHKYIKKSVNQGGLSVKEY